MCVCVFGGADRCIPLTMLVDVCHCCHLLMYHLLLFKTLSLSDLVKKESESESDLIFMIVVSIHQDWNPSIPQQS